MTRLIFYYNLFRTFWSNALSECMCFTVVFYVIRLLLHWMYGVPLMNGGSLDYFHVNMVVVGSGLTILLIGVLLIV
jgi:hypothetical protein